MKTWDDWSDKDISSEIMGIMHGEQVKHWCLSDCGKYVYDCGPFGDQFYKAYIIDINNPADMWPLILEKSITFNYDTCQVHVSSYFAEHIKVSTRRDKALRAAAIVFLMMNGVKP